MIFKHISCGRKRTKMNRWLIMLRCCKMRKLWSKKTGEKYNQSELELFAAKL